MQQEQQQLPRYGIYFSALVILIAAASQFASDMYLPSLPNIAAAFHSSNSAMGLTITIFLLGQAIFQWVYGPLSERLGRKPMILCGMVLCFIGTLICIFSASITPFFLGRFLQGAGSAALMCLAIAVVRDAFAEERLATVMSFMNMTFSIVFAVAPVIGGYLQHLWDWEASFIAVAVYLVALFILAAIALPETHLQHKRDPQAAHPGVILKNARELLSSRIFMGNTLMVGLCYTILVAYAALTPFLFQQEMGLSAVAYGWLAMINAAALVIGSGLNAALVGKLGMARMITLGLVIMLVGGAAMLATGLLHSVNVISIMLPMFIGLLGATFIFNSGGASAMMPFGHIAGTAGAMYMSVQMLAAFIAGSIAAHFHSTTQIPLATVIIILAVGSVLLNIFVVPRQK